MKGTASTEAAVIYRGIMDYYTGISGLEITIDQINKRDKFIADGVLLCDDSLDTQVLALQDKYVLAEGNSAKQNEIIEQLLQLL